MPRRIAALPPLRPVLAPGVTALVSAVARLSGRRAVADVAATDGAAGGELSVARRWTTELTPTEASGPTGHAVVEAGRRPGELRLRLVVSGDTPGARRTWRLRHPDSSPATHAVQLRINARGNGVATLVLPPSLRDPARVVVELAHLGAVLASGVLVG